MSKNSQLDNLAERWANTRRRYQPSVLAAFAAQLVEMAHSGDPELAQIGHAFPDFVLKGTRQQQVACRLAMHVPRGVPQALRDLVVPEWIDALIKILRLGAPTTRDAAVEGLGALLMLVDDPVALYPSDNALPVMREPGETAQDYARRAKISDQYFARLERRRLMALTIAGETTSSAQFHQELEEPISDKLARLLSVARVRWDEVEHALNVHSDLLRILPAMARQQQPLPPNAAELFCAAAGVLTLRDDAPPESLVALARFQESVFRTIDAAMRRPHCWNWKDFDDVVAEAVHAVPQSVAGPPSVCNAHIRATAALLRTAVKLVIHSGDSSRTKKALQAVFHNIDTHVRWSNLGIVEGCYRALPELVADARHDDLTAGALETLVRHLRRSPLPSDDLLEIHRYLIAHTCFRRMLILVSGREHREVTSTDTKTGRQLRMLLRQPAADNVRRVLQQDVDVKSGPAHFLLTDVAHPVIAGIAFDSELLKRSASMFLHWEAYGTFDKVLLIRILAAQLHTMSRDMPELRRHPVLQGLFCGIPTLSMTDNEAMVVVWDLLSALPPGAAESANAEVQRFVEYRSWDRGELPGYVLAMISPMASGRIEGAIAREIDLNLQRERRPNGGQPVDFARSLHQVMLRGPHESIFDYLLPRIRDDNDREIVRLFRRHVAHVLHTAKVGERFDLRHIRGHVRELLPDLKKRTSPTLQKLQEALELFIKVTAYKPSAWKYSTEKVVALFQTLDELAAGEHGRTPLYPVFRPRLEELQDDVARYVGMPIGHFASRKEMLAKASAIAADIEKSLDRDLGLQPPERILLLALMQYFRDLFDRTAVYYCDDARRYREANDPKRFWIHLCAARSRATRSVAQTLESQAQKERVVEVMKGAPPPFHNQRAKFEEYFVDWRTSELDVESLKKVLRKRWPPWFQSVYGIMTNFALTSLLIVVPCLVAIVADRKGFHAWEGSGFFVVTVAIIGAALLSFTQFIHVVARWLTKQKREKPGYWFQCLLPRLAGLIAATMALTVEFDHSYEFPLNASSWALFMLMVLSFFTTRFVVTRDIVDRTERPGVVRITTGEKKRVWQIVGLALGHSFGIAVLLSAIFAPSHQGAKKEPADAPKPTVQAASALRQAPVTYLLEEVDAVSPKHPRRRFLGLLPREVTFDLGKILASNGHRLPPKIAEIVGFRFYPTIILTWTALGLFYGVVLEGFMKGKRLRGQPTNEPAGEEA